MSLFRLFTGKERKQKPLTLGERGERWAQAEYKKLGFKILGANVFNRKGKRAGEIDFIARNKETIVFVEVKTRHARAEKYGTAAEAVNIYKQQKILRAVKIFLLSHSKYRNLRPQIDVCAIVVDNFEPIKSAGGGAAQQFDGVDPVRDSYAMNAGKNADKTLNPGLLNNNIRSTSNGVDKVRYSATIIPNAVEDWN